MSDRKRHEPMTLSAGEVGLIADLLRGRSDDEIDDDRDNVQRCLPVFVPERDREQARENFKRLGLL